MKEVKVVIEPFPGSKKADEDSKPAKALKRYPSLHLRFTLC